MYDVLKLTPEEMETCARIWRTYVDRIDPEFFPGMAELLLEYQTAGGIVAVVTHSEADIVNRDYMARAPGLKRDTVTGWSDAPGRHKPDPWPVVHIMDGFGLAASDVLVLDDQMPGITMAGAAGDDSAAVGWGRNHPDVLERLGDAATVVLPTVGHLRRLLL